MGCMHNVQYITSSIPGLHRNRCLSVQQSNIIHRVSNWKSETIQNWSKPTLAAILLWYLDVGFAYSTSGLELWNQYLVAVTTDLLTCWWPSIISTNNSVAIVDFVLSCKTSLHHAWLTLSLIITPRACTTGKAIGSVVIVVNKEIATSRHLGVLASVQCYEYVTTYKKVTDFGFKVLDKGHECYKSYFCSAIPIDHIRF